MHDRGDITLEPQNTTHAEGLFAALSDSRIFRYLDENPPLSVTAVKNRIARLMAGGPPDGSEIWLNWCVVQGASIVGYTQATLPRDGHASIAYVLSPEVWGTGVAQVAVEMMINELRSRHSVSTWVADTDQGNIASQRLLLRMGFAETHRDGRDVFFCKRDADIAG